MAPPQLTTEQRNAALAKAAQARRIRAEIKELLKTGSLTFSEVLEQSDDDDVIAGLKVAAVLASLPSTGKVKAKRLMQAHAIADNRRLRGLGERQRAGLLADLT